MKLFGAMPRGLLHAIPDDPGSGAPHADTFAERARRLIAEHPSLRNQLAKLPAPLALSDEEITALLRQPRRALAAVFRDRGLRLSPSQLEALAGKIAALQVAPPPVDLSRTLAHVTRPIHPAEWGAMRVALADQELAPADGPSPGYERFVSDGGIRRFVEATMRMELGFLLDEHVRVIRLQARPGRASFPLRGVLAFRGEPRRLSMAVAPVDQAREARAAEHYVVPLVSARAYLELIQREPTSNLAQEASRFSAWQFGDIQTVAWHQGRLPHFPALGAENVRRLVEDAMVHEIGELLAQGLQQDARAGSREGGALWRRWTHELSAGTERGVARFRNYIKWAHLQAKGGISPAGWAASVLNETFADKVMLFGLPDSLFFRLGWELSADERRFFSDVVAYFANKKARGMDPLGASAL